MLTCSVGFNRFLPGDTVQSDLSLLGAIGTLAVAPNFKDIDPPYASGDVMMV